MRELQDRSKGSRSSPHSALTDSELLSLFHHNPSQAWRLFIDRYANAIFSLIRSLGFDYDAAMDRFVYVCEKLCEKDFRRLKAIKYAGSRGDLTPWVRQVVKRLCINWAWSEDGRKRLLKPIARLGPFEQRVFELYFWQGLSPSEIDERLRLEHFAEVEAAAVFEALDLILSQLSEKKLWRLISNLARTRGSLSLDDVDEETGLRLDLPDEDAGPETTLLRQEQDRILQRALSHLSDRQVLALQFRFEHALSTHEVAEIMRLDEREVKKLLDSSLERLRKIMKSEQ
jgi:DNA-directed RNA polymerase specialized sigma24 family protein